MGPNQLTRFTLASSLALKFNQLSPFLPPQANHTVFVVTNSFHETNRIYEGFE